MAVPTSSDSVAADAAKPRPSSTGRGWPEWLVVLAILLLAAAFRVYALDAAPPGLWFDEAVNGVDALHVLEGERPIFFEGNQGREPLFIYAIALSFGLLGPGLLSLRLVSVAFGLLAVLAAYLLARELFGRRVALFTGLIAATTFWPVALSRLGLRAGALPVFEAAAAYCLWRAVRRGQPWWYGLAGLCLGLGVYTYLASRAVPLWLGAFGLLSMLPAWRPGVSLRRHLLGLALLAGVALLVVAPLGQYFLDHPKQLLGRVEAISLVGREASPDRPPDSIAASAVKTVGMLIWRGDPDPRHNLPGRPLLDGFLGAAGLVGLAVALRHAARPAPALILLWTAVMLLPGILAAEAPHFLRTSGILPGVLILPALGLDSLLRGAARLGHPGLRLALAVGLGLAASTGLSARDYFAAWASRADVYYSFNGDILDAGRLGEQLGEAGTALVATRTYRDAPLPLRLFPWAERTSRTFSGSDSLVFPSDASGDLYYIYPRGARRFDGSMCALLPCEAPVQVLRDPEGGEAVSVYRVAADERPTLRPATPLVARLSDYLEVFGYDVPKLLRPGEPASVTLYTRVVRPLATPGDWKLFAHLVEPGGGNRASGYAHATHAGLRPGDTIVFWLDFLQTRSLAPGLYQVHLGLFESGAQTRQRVFDAAGRDVGDLLILGPVRALASGGLSEPSEPSGPAEASFGGQIRLLGHALSREPGDPARLRVTLTWDAPSPVPVDYTVFVHVVDERGKLVAQSDAQPQGGALPTSLWVPGERVVDEHALALPEGHRGQRLSVVAGLYRLATGERLPVTAGDGQPAGDAFGLGELEPD